jgi:hypothetical protein
LCDCSRQVNSFDCGLSESVWSNSLQSIADFWELRIRGECCRGNRTRMSESVNASNFQFSLI